MKRYHSIKTGTAVPTPGFRSNAKYIIHAVAPKWKGGDKGEYEKLSAAYYSSLELADLMDCKTLAIPLLSSGHNGFDIDTAIKIAFDSIKSFDPINCLENVYLVVYGMRATNKIRQLGVSIDEIIDQAYVLKKNERIKPLSEEILDQSIDIAQKWGDYALERALTFLNDPRNIEKLLKTGVDIAGGKKVDAVVKSALKKAVQDLLK